MDVTSPNSVIVLGFIPPVRPPPLPPLAGVAPVDGATINGNDAGTGVPAGAGAGAIVACLLVVPYRKSEIEIIFAKILFFDDDRPCSEFVACVTFFTFCN